MNEKTPRPFRSNNASGWVGVSWHVARKKWAAAIRVKGRLIHLGEFTDREEAAQARADAEAEYLGRRALDAT